MDTENKKQSWSLWSRFRALITTISEFAAAHQLLVTASGTAAGGAILLVFNLFWKLPWLAQVTILALALSGFQVLAFVSITFFRWFKRLWYLDPPPSALDQMKAKTVAYRNAVWKPDDTTNEVSGVKTPERAREWHKGVIGCLNYGMVTTSFASDFVGASLGIDSVQHWKGAAEGGAGYLNQLQANIEESDIKDHESERVRQLQSVISDLKECLSPSILMERYIRDKDVKLTTFVDDRCIRDRTFENCTIRGPAIFATVDASSGSHYTWEENPDDVLWVVPQPKLNTMRNKQGVILLINVQFINCKWVNVGFVGVPAQLRALKRKLGLLESSQRPPEPPQEPSQRPQE